MREMEELTRKLQQIDPDTKTSVADIAALVDQMVCQGMSKQGAIKSLVGLAITTHRLKTEPGFKEHLIDELTKAVR